MIEIPGTQRGARGPKGNQRDPKGPKGPRGTQWDPRGPKGTQGDPRGPKGTQGDPRGPKGAFGALGGDGPMGPFGVIPKPFRMESRFEWRVITKEKHSEMKAVGAFEDYAKE